MFGLDKLKMVKLPLVSQLRIVSMLKISFILVAVLPMSSLNMQKCTKELTATITLESKEIENTIGMQTQLFKDGLQLTVSDLESNGCWMVLLRLSIMKELKTLIQKRSLLRKSLKTWKPLQLINLEKSKTLVKDRRHVIQNSLMATGMTSQRGMQLSASLEKPLISSCSLILILDSPKSKIVQTQ